MDSGSPSVPTPAAALRVTEEQAFRWLHRAMDEHAIMAITDADGVIVYVNEQFCRVSGYGRDELIGHTHSVVKSGLHTPEFFGALWRTIKAGEIWRGTICNRAKDGRLYWVESTITPVSAVAGGPPQFYIALRTDVSRLKAAESSLEWSARELEQRAHELDVVRQDRAEAQARAAGIHEQLRLFFDHAPIGISWVEWGRDGRADVYHLNRRFCEIIGLAAEEANNFENIRNATHPDDRQVQANLMGAIYRGERESFTMEKRYVHRDGTIVWGSLTVAVLRGPGGRVTHQFAMLADVTERHRAEAELREALRRREEMESIVNRSPSVVVLWRAEENGWPVEYVSQSIRQFGYQPEDFTSRRLNFRDITHPLDRERVAAEVDAHAAAGHLEYNQEYRILCADRGTRWVDDHTVVRTAPDGRVTHHEGLITDITVRREAEERERAARERDLRLAGEVQHHLRPHVFPDIGEVEIESLSQPSTHIGGDYYDVLPVDARRWGFVIADVAGKGPAAALMMSACRATLRLCAAGEPNPATVIRRVNRALHPDMPRGMFIALFYGILDLDTNKLRYVRAGHEPSLLLRAGQSEAELLSAGGLALGFDDGAIFDEALEEGEVDLRAGDLLALYTDGITEAANATGEEFGRERLAATLARPGAQTLAEVVVRTDRYLRQFSALAPRHDDRTLLLVRPRAR